MKSFSITFCLFFHFTFIHSFFWSSTNPLDKSALELIDNLQKSESGRTCFYSALTEIKDSCFDLDEDYRKKFADRLTICHLEKSGRSSSCSFPDSINYGCSWKNDMDFQIFTLFFLSIDSICQSYSQEIFRKKSQESIQDLQNSVESTSQSLEGFSGYLNEMNLYQHQFMNNFKQFEKDARTDLNEVKNTAKAINDDQTIVLEQQDKLFYEIIDSRNEIQFLSQEISKSISQIQFHENQIKKIFDQIQTIDSILNRITSAFSAHFLGQTLFVLLLFFILLRLINCSWNFNSKNQSNGRASLTNSQVSLLEKILRDNHRS